MLLNIFSNKIIFKPKFILAENKMIQLRKGFVIYNQETVTLFRNFVTPFNDENKTMESETSDAIPKNERIYLSIGLGIFALVGGLFFPFPANLMPLVGIPMIIKQIRELLK